MKIGSAEIINRKKTIFLVVFFIFLLFGIQAFAAKCNLDDWNSNDCTMDINYTDPGSGGGLFKCQYTIISGASPSCPTNGSWTDTPNCSPLCSGSSCVCTDIPISIGSEKSCSVQGTDTCIICSRAEDVAGNLGYASTSLDIDYSTPQTTIKCDDIDCLSNWDNSEDGVGITLDCKDCDNPGLDCSGCNKTYYCQDQLDSCSPTTEYTTTFNVTNEEINYVRYYSTDMAGYNEDINSQPVRIDRTVPEIIDIGPVEVMENELNYYYATTSDIYSGVDICYFYQDGANKETIYTDPAVCGSSGCSITTANQYSFLTTDSHNVGFYCYDSAGNSQYTIQEVTVNADDPPICIIFLQETEVNQIDQPNDTLHIYVGDSTDDFGIDTVKFCSDKTLNNECDTSWTTEFGWDSSDLDNGWNHETKIKEWKFTESGTYEVLAEIKDTAGNTDWPDIAPTVYVNNSPNSAIYRWSGSEYVDDPGDSWQNDNFIRYIYDYDSDGSLSSCEYYIYDNIATLTTAIGGRTPCSNGAFNDKTITVGEDLNCPSQGFNACTLAVRCTDNDIAVSEYDTATYQIDWEAPIVGTTSPTIAEVNVPQTYFVPVSDNIELEYCWLYIEGINEGSMTISPTPCQNGIPCTASLEYTFTSVGIYSMYVFCADHYDSQTGTYLNFGNGESVNVTVFAEDDQPPICEINIPDRTTISTSIYIAVGASSDFEGAMSGVKFSSDNNLNTLPDGNWDPVTDYYDWDFSSGNWNSANKTMRWSFSETGTYEVWAKVIDNVGLTDSCYDTIIVSECIPGNTKNCTSNYGCIHTITCTAQGNWPTCGSGDECTFGEIQDCGISGTQTCTDFCTWGSCVEETPECPETPPFCSICYHPECNTGTGLWECQPDAAGTDCGDCRQCNGAGTCNYICSGTESSCKCISDVCIDCSNYYDGSCGYRGVCNCGSLEIPIWSCSGGSCQCNCQYNASCEDENGNGGIGSCNAYCIFLGYENGDCNLNEAECNTAGGIYESGGDEHCSLPD